MNDKAKSIYYFSDNSKITKFIKFLQISNWRLTVVKKHANMLL